MRARSLFLDIPVGYNVVANRKSVVWAITQEKMRSMEYNGSLLLFFHVFRFFFLGCVCVCVLFLCFFFFLF